MNLVLDSGGVSALAGNRKALTELRHRREWPPVIPSVVLAESLTGDHRRDFHVNHLIGLSVVADVDEAAARRAAKLKTDTGRADEISATDAIVMAIAVQIPDANVLTSDLGDLRDLATAADRAIAVTAV